MSWNTRSLRFDTWPTARRDWLDVVMRYQGRITTWKDDQGFGFITPNGGGDPVFLHIKTFSNWQRPHTGNELVSYGVAVVKGILENRKLGSTQDKALRQVQNLHAGSN